MINGHRRLSIFLSNSNCSFYFDFDAHLSSYSEEQFLQVLTKLKIAHMIGKAVWDQKGDIRDVISIGKLVRKSDGRVEVDQILR